MSHQKIIPAIFAKVDSKGRPVVSLTVRCVTGVLLAYINLSSGGQVDFWCLLSITSSTYFSVWIIISFTNCRSRQAIRAQNDELFEEQYAWRRSSWPLAPAWLMIISVMLLICCPFAAINPVDGLGSTAYKFFQYII